MNHILISSTSYLNDSSENWNLSKNLKLIFSEYGKILFSNNNYYCEINIIFLPDIFDFYNLQKKNFTKNKKKINSLLNLIKKNLEKTKSNYIIGISDYLFNNYILQTREKNVSSQLKSYFVDKLYLLAKKFKNLYIIDVDKVLSSKGNENCFSQRNYYLMKCRLSSLGIEVLSKELQKIINRISKSNKKVLILDCDNTLWGGVIAEEGIQKIQIGQDGIGKAYTDFQKVAKFLKDRGILIVLSSKNKKKDVVNVLKNHKSMILKNKDITSYKVNWEDKSKNILDLSQELMLSLDSFVFWDDNPIEREKVRKKLKLVEVLEPDEDISLWPKQLSEYTGFLKFNSSKEDCKKTQQYKQRDKFLEKKKLFDDEINYLKTIKVKIKIEGLNKSNVDRAVQLTNKTNQFNFTTKKYNHKEIMQLHKNGNVFLTNLKDIYGDHGLISLIITKEFNNYLLIDTFLLSCRILGRYVENYLLNEVKKISVKKKLKGTIIQFIKTERNTPSLNFIDSVKCIKKIDKKSKGGLFEKFFKKKNKNNLFFLLENSEKIEYSDLYD